MISISSVFYCSIKTSSPHTLFLKYQSGTERRDDLLLGYFLIASWYLTFSSDAVVLKSDNFLQQVFIEQDPDTP